MAMHDYLLPLIEATVAALAGLPHKTYDYAPDELAPPYYTITASNQQSPKGDNRADGTVSITAWTTYAGSSESLRMLSALMPLLHRKTIPLIAGKRAAAYFVWQSTQSLTLRSDATGTVPLTGSTATFSVLIHA